MGQLNMFLLFIFLFIIWYYYNQKRQKKENKIEDEVIELDTIQLFALSIGDLETYYIDEDNNKLTAHLKEVWGFDFDEEEYSKDRAIYLLKKIWTEGTVTLFHSNIEFYQKLGIRDVVAYDSSRFVELVSQFIYLEIITQEEAWGLIYLNAQRVQDSYKSREDFESAYINGWTFKQIISSEKLKIEDFDTMKDNFRRNSIEKKEWLSEPIFALLQTYKKEKNV